MTTIELDRLGRLGGSRREAASVRIEKLAGALELYQVGTGRYPTTEMGLHALEVAPESVIGWSGPYLRRGGVPLDPWSRPYIYTSRTPDDFSIRTLGRDGEEGGTGEDADLFTTTDQLASPD